MTVKKCPVCGGDDPRTFLHRKQVPVHQNLVVPDRMAARSASRGELDLAVCGDCGFVFNRAFELDKLAYGADYDNTQSCSAHFNAYLDGLVKDLVEAQGVRHSTIIEVGCGKGQFLRKLVSYPDSANTGIGFDPSYVGVQSDLDGRLSFRRCYYDDTCTDASADVVICRHVIEHVPEPLVLLRSVHSAMKNSRNARVFFETPCVEWILRNRVVWDFFYEHCSLFSTASLSLAFEVTGFEVERVKHIFGGQYLWLQARVAPSTAAGVSAKDSETAALALDYGADEHLLCQKWLSRLEVLKSRGNVAVWGAGAKGATFVNLMDPDAALIECVVDINPHKQGKFIPGSGHPIIAPKELVRLGVRSAVLMNPNYRDENSRLLTEAGLEIELIDWGE
jgi:SAM-dependent methyltransferase